MSDADSPNNQPGLPSPTEPAETTTVIGATAAQVPDPADHEPVNDRPGSLEGWQTVDFPGAMSVDAIPRAHAEGGSVAVPPGVIYYSSAEISTGTMYAAAVPTQTSDEAIQTDEATQRQPLQQLQAENAALRDRLMQAEHELAQQQIEWQLEAARILVQSEAADATVKQLNDWSETDATELVPALEPTHERLHQLLQELARSQQTAQRQQILVETLTEQLESSQERIAQLERDCALTQQRHHEQVQQVLQAEGTCRDLRLRLHRQQQQTLQFKAALEKCLEMPTPYEQPSMPDVALDPSAVAPDALAALLLKFKNQPVKPWTLTAQADNAPASDQAELPRPLFKLLKHHLSLQDGEAELAQGQDDQLLGHDAPFSTAFTQEDVLPAAADPSALLDSDDPQFVAHLMQLIFPDTAEPSTYTTADALQAEPIFDLSPFSGTELLSTENDNTGAVPLVDVSSQAAPSSQVNVSSQSESVLLPRSPAWQLVPTAPQQQQDSVLSEGGSEPEAIAAASVLPANASTDPCWDDLAMLIDPSLAVEPATAVSAVDAHEQIEVVTAPTQAGAGLVPAQRPLKTFPTQTGIPPLFTAAYDASQAVNSSLKEPTDVQEQELTDAIVPSPAGWTWRDRMISTTGQPARSTTIERATQSPSTLALSGASRQISASSEIESTPAPFDLHSPSPLVYPLRYTKKLASLAAVDLPSFPKR